MTTIPDQGLPVAPPAVALALIDLADCVCAELTATGAGPTCWCGLYPGASVSWEYCGECGSGTCGMGYVRAAGVFPFESFPTPSIDIQCARPLAWAIEVGALRCMPTPEDGEIASPIVMSEVVLAQVMDAKALHTAIKCCGYEVSVERYYPAGPAGGCVGGFWVAYLNLD